MCTYIRTCTHKCIKTDFIDRVISYELCMCTCMYCASIYLFMKTHTHTHNEIQPLPSLMHVRMYACIPVSPGVPRAESEPKGCDCVRVKTGGRGTVCAIFLSTESLSSPISSSLPRWAMYCIHTLLSCRFNHSYTPSCHRVPSAPVCHCLRIVYVFSNTRCHLACVLPN